LRGQSSRYRDREPDLFGFPASKDHFEHGSDDKANSAEEVIGEIGLVLGVILGIVISINMVLVALHIS
jgi:hypothetical protein